MSLINMFFGGKKKRRRTKSTKRRKRTKKRRKSKKRAGSGRPTQKEQYLQGPVKNDAYFKDVLSKLPIHGLSGKVNKGGIMYNEYRRKYCPLRDRTNSKIAFMANGKPCPFPLSGGRRTRRRHGGDPTSEELAGLSCKQKAFKDCRSSGKMDYYCKSKAMDKCEKWVQGGKRRRRRRKSRKKRKTKHRR
jgi:hypothetical protein